MERRWRGVGVSVTSRPSVRFQTTAPPLHPLHWFSAYSSPVSVARPAVDGAPVDPVEAALAVVEIAKPVNPPPAADPAKTTTTEAEVSTWMPLAECSPAARGAIVETRSRSGGDQGAPR